MTGTAEISKSSVGQDILPHFFAYLRNERHYSEHTLKAYRRDLEHIYMGVKEWIGADWGRLKPQHVRTIAAEFNRQGKSSRSIQRYLSTLRSFYRFLMREGLVQFSPVQGVHAPKSGKRLPAVLDADQVNSLLQQPTDSENDFLVKRDFAMMELLYSSGLRLNELVQLDVGDLDLHSGLVRVIGKGSKSRVVPVGRIAKERIQDWLTLSEEITRDVDDKALFVTRKGKRISARAVQARIRLWGQKQAISDKVHPHRMRHAFASHLLESSGDIRAVQELLGHANLSTTQIYTHLDFQHLAEVYDKAHPRSNIKDNKPGKTQARGEFGPAKGTREQQDGMPVRCSTRNSSRNPKKTDN